MRPFLELSSSAAALTALSLFLGTACGGRNSSEETESSAGMAANGLGGSSTRGGNSAGPVAGTAGLANIAGDSATGGTASPGGSPGTAGGAGGTDSKPNGGSSGMGGSWAGSSSSGGGGGASPFPAAACGKAGGVCVSAGSCAEAGGKVTSDPGGCHFDDGPAECCVPPAPNPDGKQCADLGGICTPIGGCLSAGGQFTPQDPCTDPEQACCVASASCGTATIKCCEGGTTFRPACDNGKFVCVVGQPHDLSFNCGP
jgi:hypothetical protein